MNAAETRVIIGMVQALRPGQPFPDAERDPAGARTALLAWQMLLQDVTTEDATNAVVKIGADENRRFIEAQHILAEVRRVRARRVELNAHRAPAPEVVGADGRDISPEAFMAELRRRTAAIANSPAAERWPRAVEAPKGPEYVGKPSQWQDGDAPIEHRPGLEAVRGVLAAMAARREPERLRALPPPLPPAEVAAYDEARRVLAGEPDNGEALVHEARAAAPDATHVQHLIAAAAEVQKRTRKAS